MRSVQSNMALRIVVRLDKEMSLGKVSEARSEKGTEVISVFLL